MDGLVINYYEIANEAIGFDGIKGKIDRIIVSVRNWIQRMVNWVSTKFTKFMNMDHVQISQNYYNEIMGTIKSIMNVDTMSIDRIAMDFHTIRNNPEAVKKAGENIAKKLQDMKDLKENMEKISPSENDRQLTLTQSNLKSFQSQLYSMRDKAQRKLQVVMRMKREPLDSENLKYTQAQVMLIGQTCLINQTKSQLCIDLMDKLMKNSKVVEKDSKKKEDDIVDDDTGKKKEKSNMNNHEKLLSASESVIQMCDELYIAEEKYSDAKKIYKEGNKQLVELLERIENMPEGTSTEAEAKKDAYDQLASRVYDIYQEVGKVRASGADKFLSGLMRFTAGVTDAIADSKIRSTAYDLSAQSPELSSKVKDIAIFTGVKWLARVIGNGTGGERSIRRIREKLSTLYDKYTSEVKRLRMKAAELAKKEASENASKEESKKENSKASEGATFWDELLIPAEEGLIETIRIKIKSKFKRDKPSKPVITEYIDKDDYSIPHNGYHILIQNTKGKEKSLVIEHAMTMANLFDTNRKTFEEAVEKYFNSPGIKNVGGLSMRDFKPILLALNLNNFGSMTIYYKNNGTSYEGRGLSMSYNIKTELFSAEIDDD